MSDEDGVSPLMTAADRARGNGSRCELEAILALLDAGAEALAVVSEDLA